MSKYSCLNRFHFFLSVPKSTYRKWTISETKNKDGLSLALSSLDLNEIQQKLFAPTSDRPITLPLPYSPSLLARSHVIYIFCPKPLLRCLSRLCYTKRSCRTMRTTTTTMCEVYSGQLSKEMFINTCKSVDAPQGIKTNGPKICHGIRRRTKWRTNKKVTRDLCRVILFVTGRTLSKYQFT